jgi:hypothetical protein
LVSPIEAVPPTSTTLSGDIHKAIEKARGGE